MTDDPRERTEAAEKWDKIVDLLSEETDKAQADIEFSPEMDSKLAEIEQRAHRAKATETVSRTKPKKSAIRGDDATDYQGLGTGLSAAYAIIGLPIAGWLVGLAMGRFGGNPNAMVPCVMTGVVLGFVMAYVVLQRNSKG